MKNHHSYISVFLILILLSCQREKYDFGQIPDLNPDEYVTPIAVLEFSMGGFLESLDENPIQVDADSSLRLVYEVDSLAIFNTADFFELESQYNFNFPLSVPFLKVSEEVLDQSVSIADMLSSFDASTAQNFNNASGNTVPFPQINDQFGGTHGLPVANSFGSVEFLTSEFELTITNNWPADIQSLNVEIRSGAAIIGVYNFGAITAGSSQTLSVSHSGMINGADLDLRIVNIQSPGTANPTLVDLTDELSFSVHQKNGTSNSGMFTPSTELLFELETALNFSFPYQEEVIELQFNGGAMSGSGASGPGYLDFSFVFPGITNTSQDTFRLNFSSQAPGSRDLNNYTADLTTNTTQPYNTIPIRAEVYSSASSMVFVSPNDLSFELQLEFQDPSFSLALGYFGQRPQNINQADASFEIPFLEKISGNITLSDPNLIITSRNSMGVPVEIDVDIIGENTNSGNQTSLGASPQILAYPDLTQIGQSIYGEIGYTPNNSSIVSFLSVLPNNIGMNGSLISNPNGNVPPMQNHLLGDGEAIFGLKLELGLDFRIQDLFFTDTLDLEALEIDLGDTLQLERLVLYINSLNGFGLTADLELEFLDSEGQIIESQQLPLLSAAQVDSDGRVIDPSLSKSELDLSSSILEQLNSGSKIVFKVTFNSPGGGQQDFILHYSNFLKLYTAAEVKLKVEL